MIIVIASMARWRLEWERAEKTDKKASGGAGVWLRQTSRKLRQTSTTRGRRLQPARHPTPSAQRRCSDHEREVAVVAIRGVCSTSLPFGAPVALPHGSPTPTGRRPAHPQQYPAQSPVVVGLQRRSPPCLVRPRHPQARLQAGPPARSARRNRSREPGIHSVPSSSSVCL